MESKKTILTCHAYNKLNGKERSNFLKYFNKPKKTYKDLVAVRKILINAGSLDYSLKEADKRIKGTLNMLGELKMQPKYKAVIKEAIMQLFKHSNRIAKQYKITV